MLIIFVALIFFVISIERAVKSGYMLNFRTIVQISLVLFPALYAYVLVNLLSINTIVKIFKITFIIGVCFYVYEVGVGTFLNIDNWLSISYLHSYSPFENSTYPEVFLYCFFFFNYFTMLAFKRLQILAAIGVFLLSMLINMRKKFKNQYAICLAIIFIIGTIIYKKFVSGEIDILGIDPYYFTTGRSYILQLWGDKDFLSYGFGTSMLVINRYLEMDLIQIYMELGIFALGIFSIVYFWIVRKNIYATIIMIYSFGNMLTASSLPGSLGWVLVFVLVSIIGQEDNGKNVVFEQKQYKIKNRFILKKHFCIKRQEKNR